MRCQCYLSVGLPSFCVGALRDFLWPKVVRKTLHAALVIFIGTILGGYPRVFSGIVGALLFFLVFLGAYAYNDLLDLRRDRERWVAKEKVLARGNASETAFFAILGILFPLSVLLSTLWDPLLGIFATAGAVLNNVRTHVRRWALREILLALVEFLNVEALWQAFFGSPIPAIFIPLFAAYSFAYTLTHVVYSRALRDADKDLREVLRTRTARGVVLLFLLALFFGVPALFLSPYHFALLGVAAALYSLPVLLSVRRAGLSTTSDYQLPLALFISAVLVLGAVAYLLFGPIPIPTPLSDYLSPYYRTAAYFDALQRAIVNSALGDLHGLRTRVD